ncbi:MAG: hypothetical protein KGN74_09505 [Gemmatimonadota bacterium]|nr:hypothetical protein [Gemmatimonadota bacterium]
MRFRPGAAAVALWVTWAGAARAQRVPGTVACRGQRITAIDITSEAPSVAGVRRVPVVSEIARTVHTTTQPQVIRRFLLLKVGDWCAERARQESERILRAQPFLADARILVRPDSGGGVTLDVHTIDEVALVFSSTLRNRGPLLTGVRLGDGNTGGEGIYLMSSWWKEAALRDGYAFNLTDYQFLGRPIQATVLAARNPLGGAYYLGVQRPFLTDFQRAAWRVQQGESDDYVRFVDQAGVVHADRLGRTYADIGGLARIGAPGRLALVGLSVSHEATRLGAAPILVTGQGVAPDPGPVLDGRYDSRSSSRVNLLLGYRNLRFVRATGFDALRNTQDLPVGVQIGGLIGKSAPFLGSRGHDMLVGGDVYAGAGWRRAAIRFQTTGEMRRSLATNAWDGLLVSGRLAEYNKIGMRQTVITSLEWGGGWRVRVPFRVTLAGTDGGIRGMPEGREQGARRSILRLEDRIDLGSHLGQTADFGLAVFADAGRMWAGDVPFGTTTPVRYSVGVSLLAAFPAASARMWRLDIAVPNVPGRGPQLALRLSHSDESLTFWREPRDIAMARERSVPASLFNWP